jgi:hypothetical protein
MRAPYWSTGLIEGEFFPTAQKRKVDDGNEKQKATHERVNTDAS